METGHGIRAVAGDSIEAGVAVTGGQLQAEYVAGRDLHLHPPATSQPKPIPVYLPAAPANVVARDWYFDRMRAALVDARDGLFLLSGDPGSGKSTLALMFALRVRKDFEAVIYQTCGPERGVEAIVGALADTLKEQIGEHLTQLPVERQLEAIQHWLRQRRSLLVLDDVWLNAGSALHLRDLLPGPPVSVLYTSRRPALPWVGAEHCVRVEAFTPAEVEDTFRLYLGAAMVERHREELLRFAGRIERLPLAVTVGAQLLQAQSGPLREAAQALELSKLSNEAHDVPGLLRYAIEMQGVDERLLLAAAAVSSGEDFWMPLAWAAAGLEPASGEDARDRLVNAGLLRLLDQDRQRFHLHALVREQMRGMLAAGLDAVHENHAQALERLFEDWESRWRECRECLPEIAPAGQRLFEKQEMGRAVRLMFLGYAMAQRIGELAIALQIMKSAEVLWLREASEAPAAKNGLQASYGNQALILRDWGRLEEALALHQKQEAICEELDNKADLQASYGNQALILRDWGRLEEALALHQKQEAICEELGNKAGLQASYGNQASILMAWGCLEEALALLKKTEVIYNALGNKDGLQRSYGNQALILRAWGRLEEALALLKQQEAICEELGNKASLAICYANWGVLARELRDRPTEKQKLQAAIALFTELKMPRERDAVQKELEGGPTGA